MASTRLLSRLLVPTSLNRFSQSAGPVRHFFFRNPRNLPDVYVGSTPSVFRDLEREFERMQRQFDHVFHGNAKTTSDENNMIVTEADGSRKFQLALDMRGFAPEEVKIKSQNGTLTISGKKEKKADNSYSLHEFSQSYTLPEDLKADELKSTYSESGVLSIEAPLPKVESKERQIQIEHSK